MILIFIILAFILAWFFIEITLFFSSKHFNIINNIGNISYKQFIWTLRMIATLLFLCTSIYMYNFENDKLVGALEYCLGIIK